MSGAQTEEREITDIGQLCEFELLKKEQSGDEQVGGQGIRKFQARVAYMMIKYIKVEEGITYDHGYLVGGYYGGITARHVLIPSPFPEISYYEMPGETEGVVAAESLEDIHRVASKTATFVKRRLIKDKVFSETMGLQVSEPLVTDFEEPRHMAFLIDNRFNYVVGKIEFQVSGYGTPMENCAD